VLLLPQLWTVGRTGIPVIAAGGYFDGRAWSRRWRTRRRNRDGTRFLLTSDSEVSVDVKNVYRAPVTGTVVTVRSTGPHRVVSSRSGTTWKIRSAATPSTSIATPVAFHRCPACARDMLARDDQHRARVDVESVLMRANTPILLRAAMAEQARSGRDGSGQVVGVIIDLHLPRTDRRIMDEAGRIGRLREGYSPESG